MKIYVQAKSKKAINEMLMAGQTISGMNYSIFGDGGMYILSSALPAGTVIAIYQKVVGNSPYATTFGTWDGKKVK